MPSVYFAANKKITGGALFASFNSKDGSVFFNIFPQIADNANKKDNFDFKNSVNVKLSQDEVGDIIQAVRNKGEAKFYHQFEENKTSGSFRYYKVASKDPKYPDREGFGFSANKNGKEVKVGFTLGSAERLSQYLIFSLQHINSAIYSEDVAKGKEYAKTKATNGSKPAETKVLETKVLETKVLEPESDAPPTEGEIDF